MVGGNFLIYMVFRLLKNAVASQKTESRHFYLCYHTHETLAQVTIIKPQTEITHSLLTAFFQKSIPPATAV